MTTFSVIAARDGDVYHDAVEANDQAEAETKAREQLAEAWHMTDELALAREEGDESAFDAELDGFAVDPEPAPIGALPLAAIAGIFADAKDAPTSFEPEEWLEGFEDGRGMIAHRIALALPEADRRAFLVAARVEAAHG
jgi:hypothetical protein